VAKGSTLFILLSFVPSRILFLTRSYLEEQAITQANSVKKKAEHEFGGPSEGHQLPDAMQREAVPAVFSSAGSLIWCATEWWSM
jgi:hypothetical protein